MRTITRTIAACLTMSGLCLTYCQTSPPGRDSVYQKYPIIVQFGSGPKYTANASRIELWGKLRESSNDGLTEIESLAGLQSSLPRRLVLAEASLMGYRARLRVFRHVVSEKPNDEFMALWKGKAAGEKSDKGAEGLPDDLEPGTALDALKDLQPESFYSAWLYDAVKGQLDGFSSTQSSVFTDAEWDGIAEGKIADIFDEDWRTVSAIRAMLPGWSDKPELGDIKAELGRATSELQSVSDLVGTALALAPKGVYDDILAKKGSACQALEQGLDRFLLPDLGEVRAGTADQTGYVVVLTSSDDPNVSMTVGFAAEYGGRKFYSVNTAGPFFFDLPSFSYSVEKKTVNGTDTFKLVESGKQSSMKSSVGAFYNQMVMVSDDFHLGLSVGVVASENSRIGYGIGLTGRIGGIFLTFGQLYTPVTEARFAPGSTFGTAEDAAAAKALGQDSFKWRPFIGLALRF